MGFVEDIINGIVGAFTDLVMGLLDTLIINPLESFVGALMGFLQDVIIGTPYPRREVGEPYPAVIQEPANQPWVFLYELHENIFQPYAYLLLFITILTIVFLEIVGSAVNVNSFQSQINSAKSKFFSAFLLITFWWYIGTLVLAASDALTSLLMSAVNSGDGNNPDSVGLAAIWETAAEQISGEGGSSGADDGSDPSGGSSISRLLMIPLILVWLMEAVLLLIIALLWVLRMFVIFVMMPVMPIFIALWVMHIPGFDGIQDIGEDAMKWFVSLAFITLPAAIVVAVSGRIIEDVLSFGTSAITGGSGSGNGNNQLQGYDTTELISHPQVGGSVYGDGVSGLGANDPAQAGALAGLGAIIFAVLIVIAVPVLAGLAPFLMYRSEVGTLAAGAVNPAAGMASAASSVKDSVKSSTKKANMARNRNFDELSEKFEENVSGDDIGQKMKSNPGALFGAASAKMASQTQTQASQMKDRAGQAREELPQRAMSGMARVDNAQMMIQEHRGELADVGKERMKERAKKTVNPHKQAARMQSLANKPGDAVESFEEKVAEQRNSINNRLDNRKLRKQRVKDMSPAEIRAGLGPEPYTPDEGDLDTLIDNDKSIVDDSRKDGMLEEIRQFRTRGDQSQDMAIKSMTAMEETIADGLAGTSINPDPYLSEIAEYREQVMRGDMSPARAMKAIEEVENRMEKEIQARSDVKRKYEEMEENYEKFGANMSQGEFAAQSMSIAEMNNLPGLEDVIGSYGIRDNRARQALEEAGLDPENYNMAELKEDPDRLASLVGADTFNQLEVSDKFEAEETIDREGAKQFTDFEESELSSYDVSTLQSAIDNEAESDLDAGKAKSMFADDMDRVTLSSFDSDDMANKLVSDMSKGDWNDSVDTDGLSDTLGIDKDEIQNALDNIDYDETLENTRVGQQIEAQIKSQLTKEVGKAHGKAARELKDTKAAIAQQQVVAQEEYATQMMREMVENAPSKEAAVTLLESQKGALMEAADVDPQEFGNETGIDEATRKEFVRDIVEQELTGEEIESAISERFHEEFEDTTEMLENIEEVQGAREVVKQVNEALDEDMDIADLKSDTVGGMDAEMLMNNPDQAAEGMFGDTLEELQKLESGEIDSDTLDQFDVELDSSESIVADDEKAALQDKAREQAAEAVEQQIEQQFGVTTQELDVDEVTSDNLGEVVREATIEKQTRELDQKMAAKQMGDKIDQESKAAPRVETDE